MTNITVKKKVQARRLRKVNEHLEQKKRKYITSTIHQNTKMKKKKTNKKNCIPTTYIYILNALSTFPPHTFFLYFLIKQGEKCHQS